MAGRVGVCIPRQNKNIRISMVRRCGYCSRTSCMVHSGRIVGNAAGKISNTAGNNVAQRQRSQQKSVSRKSPIDCHRVSPAAPVWGGDGKGNCVGAFRKSHRMVVDIRQRVRRRDNHSRLGIARHGAINDNGVIAVDNVDCVVSDDWIKIRK